MPERFREFMRNFSKLPRRVRGFLFPLAKWFQRLDTRLTKLSVAVDELEQRTLRTNKDMLYTSVGRALSAWASMEQYLVLIVGFQLRVDPQRAGLLMYSIINFNTWLSIINDLFEDDETLKPFRRRWNKIAERIRRIKDTRDRLAHHPLKELPDDVIPALLAPTLDTRLKSKSQKPVSLTEVVEFTDAVLTVADDLHALVVELNNAAYPSPDKSVSLAVDQSRTPGSL